MLDLYYLVVVYLNKYDDDDDDNDDVNSAKYAQESNNMGRWRRCEGVKS